MHCQQNVMYLRKWLSAQPFSKLHGCEADEDSYKDKLCDITAVSIGENRVLDTVTELMAVLTKEQFVSLTRTLLEKERTAEIEETRVLNENLPAKELQRRGVCLLGLNISSRKTGYYGRILVAFDTDKEALPSHSLTPGDIVGLSLTTAERATDELHSGIVTHVSQSAISVAFDDSQDLFSLSDDLKYKLMKLANDVTYKRLKRALDNLGAGVDGPAAFLCSVLFGEQPVSDPLELKEITLANENLDDSQREAVNFALCQKELAVIHGPPGTGKTTTVVEIILQCVRRGDKVLACAPSNIAVDNLVERLVNSKHKVVRIGHPARVLPHIQKYSLDAILSASEEAKVVEDVRKDIDNALTELRTTNDSGRRRKLMADLKFWRKELRERSNAATKAILKRADVVLVTLTSATEDGPIKFLEENHFDIVVIDEVSQALEAACWIPLLRTGKCVLAGDHYQLPPTILSKEAAKEGLERTLMERVIDIHGEKIVRMLTTQYRMNHKIMQWSSDQLYQSRLVAHNSVENHLLIDMSGIEETEDTSQPLLLIDTAGCDLNELDLPEEVSKGNEGEASIVVSHVKRLVDSGLKPADIAVIAPYNLQVDLIRARLSNDLPGLEVKTVDGFQGREKEAVVISLVRSNDKGEVGFLSERRRINVAVTRARRHLAVIGDSETVSHDEFLKSLIEYLHKEGEVRSAQEFVEDGSVFKSVTRPDHLDDLLSLSKSKSDKGARPKVSKQTRKKETKRPAEFNKGDKTNAVERSENTQSRLEELQAELDDFIANEDSDLLVFPSSLTSHDRFLVHELAEKMGLAHISKGTDSDRHIVVSKPGSESQTVYQSEAESHSVSVMNQSEHLSQKVPNQSDKASQKETSDETGKENVVTDQMNIETKDGNEPLETVCIPKDSGKLSCKWCNKDVIKANIQLHELGCPKNPNKNRKPCSVPSKKQEPASKSSAPRKFDKELAKKINKVDDDDIDTLIATVQKMDSSCCFKKCKTSVQTLCNVCNFCQGRYCMSHHMPEIHGCGDAARAAARARISKEGVLYRGSGVPDKKPDAAKKAHLQRKLEHKLSEMSGKRKIKQKK